jgi:uncharacterized membrane protein YtjA (UPF0391 family)
MAPPVSDDADRAMRLWRQASLSCALYNNRRIVQQQYRHGTREIDMLYYAVVFLVIALIAGALGFFGIAGAAVGIAKILFFVFLVLFVVSLVLGRRAPPTV